MMTTIDSELKEIKANGNLRRIPADSTESGRVDFSGNDYLGLSLRTDLRDEFLSNTDPADMIMSASASRLLASRQKAFSAFENVLEKAYGRSALLFNSGYHANTGMVSALATKDYTILADKLVHASIIDGIRLSGAPFERFRHNDMRHLSSLAEKASAQGRKLLIIAESVYSMDGDKAPIGELAEIKRKYPDALLYIDEAHAVGVEGPAGLGECMRPGICADDVDVVVGTLGKALASAGAYVIASESVRSWAINRARSFIFSTALPPVNVLWSKFIFEKAMDMDSGRRKLKQLGGRLGEALGTGSESHIQPYMVGDPHEALRISRILKDDGFDVLPIRTPTVPPGTDRLRISLSAALNEDDIISLGNALNRLKHE